MFVDASAIVAILKGEPEGSGFLAALDAANKVFTSPIVRFEATISLAAQMARGRGDLHMTAGDHAAAEELVEALLTEVQARDMHITEGIGRGRRDAPHWPMARFRAILPN